MSTNYTTCTDCLAPILWTQKPDGEWNTPLDVQAGVSGIAIINGSPEITTVYHPHRCQESRDRYREEQQSKPPRIAPPVPKRRQFDSPINRPCPHPGCRAEPGEYCRKALVYKRIGVPVERDWRRSHNVRENLVRTDLTPRDKTYAVEHDAMMDQRELDDHIRKSRAARKTSEVHQRIADAIACPKCEAEVGTRCWNVHDRRYGREVHVVQVHPARAQAWNKMNDEFEPTGEPADELDTDEGWPLNIRLSSAGVPSYICALLKAHFDVVTTDDAAERLTREQFLDLRQVGPVRAEEFRKILKTCGYDWPPTPTTEEN